jgi:hypothetical protein
MELIHPFLRDFKTEISIYKDRRTWERALKLCCLLLDDDSDTLGDDQFRSNSGTFLIDLIVTYIILYHKPLLHTQWQFDMAR